MSVEHNFHLDLASPPPSRASAESAVDRGENLSDDHANKMRSALFALEEREDQKHREHNIQREELQETWGNLTSLRYFINELKTVTLHSIKDNGTVAVEEAEMALAPH